MLFYESEIGKVGRLEDVAVYVRCLYIFCLRRPLTIGAYKGRMKNVYQNIWVIAYAQSLLIAVN
jgi:hypothetical protein